VLRIVTDDASVYQLLTITGICSGEVFGPEELKGEVLSWFSASGRALFRLRDKSLSSKRKACLRTT